MSEEVKVDGFKKLKFLFWTTLVIYGALFAWSSMIDLSFLKGEIIAYGIQCTDKPVYNTCSNPAYALGDTHYKPLKDRQEVLYYTRGFAPSRLKDCAVVDRKNWQCSFDDKSATFGFQKGNYFSFVSEEQEARSGKFIKDYYVSKRTWVIQDCKNSIFPVMLCIPFHGTLRGI